MFCCNVPFYSLHQNICGQNFKYSNNSQIISRPLFPAKLKLHAAIFLNPVYLGFSSDNFGCILLRALGSRSLRDGSLSYKGRFATFVRSSSALRASRRPLKISYLKSACLITPFAVGIKFIRLFLKFVYFMKTTINIHIRNF